MVDTNRDTSMGWIPMHVAAVMVGKTEKTLMRWTKRAQNRLEFFYNGKTPCTTREALDRVRVFPQGQPAQATDPRHDIAIQYLRECGLKV